MAAFDRRPGRGEEEPRGDRDESLLRGGLRGIALVTLATVALGLVAAVLAVVVSLLY